MTRPRWQEHAACRGKTELFFPDFPNGARLNVQRSAAEEALALCRTCPVIIQCGEAGKNEEYGIWGGRLPAARDVSEAAYRRRYRARRREGAA